MVIMKDKGGRSSREGRGGRGGRGGIWEGRTRGRRMVGKNERITERTKVMKGKKEEREVGRKEGRKVGRQIGRYEGRKRRGGRSQYIYIFIWGGRGWGRQYIYI